MKNLTLDYIAECRKVFPYEYALAQAANELVITATEGKDFSALERHSPALKGFQWSSYLRLSAIRMVRVLRYLLNSLKPGARVLDFGSYFGNFSLMLSDAGFRVTAQDSYTSYGTCFVEVLDLLKKRDIDIIEKLPTDNDDKIAPEFDAVLLMGVIEHIPHTPRLLFQTINAVLKLGGLLVLDTPNLAYIYTRQRLARGESVFTPIQSQYWTELPFEGHHREYTRGEVEWMLGASGFEIMSFEAFNYSLYGLSQISGIDLANFRQMELDSSMRELLLFSARRQNI